MTLFCLSFDFLIKPCVNFKNPLKISGVELLILTYADVVVFIDRSGSLLASMLEKIVALAIQVRLTFNSPKCGYFLLQNKQSLKLTQTELKTYDIPIPIVS